MRLLFDQNLAASLVQRLADLYPGSLHVREVGLERADDAVVWAYAGENGLMIVSKDSDLTDEIEAILRGHHADLVKFGEDPGAAFLIID
ncbi:MAG: DUF5615 family PIN-like protein [Gemmatimonadota bacterium]